MCCTPEMKVTLYVNYIQVKTLKNTYKVLSTMHDVWYSLNKSEIIFVINNKGTSSI